MRQSLLIMLILISTFSCQNKTTKTYQDNAKLCDLLSQMAQQQEQLHTTSKFVDPFFEVLDSMRAVQKLSRDDYAKLPRETQIQWGNEARAIAKQRSEQALQYRDSIQQELKQLTQQHTKELIAIIKERGWITHAELGCDMSISPTSILKQAPQEYWNELKPIIDDAYNMQRMSTKDYESLYLVLYQEPSNGSLGKK